MLDHTEAKHQPALILWLRRLPFGTRLLLLLAAALLPVVAALLLPALPQPQAYHDFADQRPLAGIPNFGDVASNAAFLLVGIAGLAWLWPRRHPRAGAFTHRGESLPWLVLFGATALVAFGSSWYHLAPDNLRLYWDRMPMTLAFMAITAALLGDRIHPRLGLIALPLLLLLGMAGASAWLWSELQGRGDLRPYLLVQAVPLCAAPVLLALFPNRYSHGRDVLVTAGLYLLALLTERLDHALFTLSAGIISGHTLKHLLAALAVYWLLRMLRRRRALTFSAR